MPFIIIGVVIAVVIILALSIKKDDKKKKDYSDSYITEKAIEDSFFGKINFSYDSRKNELKCKGFEPAFCGYKPTLQICDYSEQDNEFYFRNLEHLYDRQAEILSGLADEFCESYEEVAHDDAEKNICIEWITIEKLDDYYREKICDSDDIFIAVQGKYTGGSGYYQLPYAFMNCVTKEIFYSIEE